MDNIHHGSQELPIVHSYNLYHAQSNCTCIKRVDVGTYEILIFIAHLYCRLSQMEAVDDDGEDATDVPEASGVGANASAGVPWDPLKSPDWDKETHTRDAIVRIKG